MLHKSISLVAALTFASSVGVLIGCQPPATTVTAIDNVSAGDLVIRIDGIAPSNSAGSARSVQQAKASQVEVLRVFAQTTTGFEASTTITTAQLSAGRGYAVIKQLPLGVVATISLRAYDNANQSLGSTSKTVTVLSDQATTVHFDLQLDHLVLLPGDLHTGVAIQDGQTRIVTIDVSTLAGNGTRASLDGNGVDAQIFEPRDVKVDSKGNAYVAEPNAVRKITPAGIVSTFAGAQGSPGFIDANGSAARFNDIRGLAIDASDNLYVVERGNARVRKVTPEGDVTTFAGYGVRSLYLSNPEGIAVAPNGDVYVAETGYHCIRKLPARGGLLTVAGTRQAAPSDLSSPTGLAVDMEGTLYIADTGHNRIVKLVGSELEVVAGTGTAGFVDGTDEAQFNGPRGLIFDGSSKLYVGDSNNHRVRVITFTGGLPEVRTVAGGSNGTFGEGSGGSARFNYPRGLAIEPDTKTVYVADFGNNRVRKVSQVLSPIPQASPQGLSEFSEDVGNLVGSRYLHTAAKVGKYVYVVGGMNATGGYQSYPERATIQNDSLGSFSRLTEAGLSQNRYGHATFVKGNKIHMLGGFGFDGTNFTTLRSAWAYTMNDDGSLSGPVWSGTPYMTQARFAPAAILVNSTVFVLGGRKDSTYYNTMENGGFSGANEVSSFSMMSPTLETGRSQFTVEKIGNYLYAIGGQGSTGALASVERTEFNGWISSSFTSSNIPKLTAPRYGHTSAVVGNYLYIFGGTRNYQPTNTVERARIYTDGSLGSFSLVDMSIPAPRRDHASVLTGSHLFLLGGYATDTGALQSIIRSTIQ